MKNPEDKNQEINANEDEVSAAKADVNDTALPANDAFKTSKKSQGLTWQGPADEQAFDDNEKDEED